MKSNILFIGYEKKIGKTLKTLSSIIYMLWQLTLGKSIVKPHF